MAGINSRWRRGAVRYPSTDPNRGVIDKLRPNGWFRGARAPGAVQYANAKDKVEFLSHQVPR